MQEFRHLWGIIREDVLVRCFPITTRSLRNFLLLSAITCLFTFISGCGIAPLEKSTRRDDKAEKGVFQLEHVDFAEQSVLLQGEWEFYWQQLLSPADLQASDGDAPLYITLPHSWNGYMWHGGSLPSDGYATFRVLLRIGEEHIGESLAIRMPEINNSYKLWIDGELFVEVGQVGTNKHSAEPNLATRLVEFQPHNDQVELVIQVANFHYTRGGITKHIELGDSKTLTAKTNMKTSFDLLASATLFIVGAYNLLLYIQRRKDMASLYFAIFSLLWAVRPLLDGELIVTKVFPDFPWELQIKVEYLVFYVSPYFFMMYFYYLFKELSRSILVISGTLAGVFSLIVIFFPAKIYSPTFSIFQFIIVLHIVYFILALNRAVKKRKQGAVVFMIVSIFAAATIVVDIFIYNEWLMIGRMSILGFIIFTCTQMVLLSTRFAKALASEEKAAQEEGRKKLLSYITHDLRAPLATMMGYVEAVQDRVNPEKNEVYLKYVYEKTVWLNRMIEDLSFLSQLETSQVTFTMRALDMEAYVQEMWQKYELVIQETGLHSELAVSNVIDDGCPLYVWGDPLRIEQALSNIISNALKFTPPGGKVLLSLTYRKNKGDGHAMISVIDNGIGISPEHLEHIFERNYRLYPDRADFVQDTAGSGLGLAIAKEIVDRHEGEIWAESDGIEGSVFFISLPLMTEQFKKDGEMGDGK